MTASSITDSADGAPPLVSSRFNFFVPSLEGPLLFNSSTGAVVALDGADGTALAKTLAASNGTGWVATEVVNALPEPVLANLVDGGFLLPAGSDELAAVRQRYLTARRQTPVVITITTTMDCNLGCYYCYEERSTAALEASDVNALIDLAAERIAAAGRKALHVDWYSGEPLLNLEFLEVASASLQAYCRQTGVKYTASVISNGTCWPKDVASFVGRHAITQVQISFDGLRANHDRRRRYRKGYAPGLEASSFDLAAALVDCLVQCVRVDVRLNLDRGNQRDLLPFVRFARDRGWFEGRFRATLQPARLSSYSDRSSFLRRTELTVEEYNELRALARDAAGDSVSVEESEAPDGFPHPRTSVCAALASDSAVVGADGQLYRCGLQVGEPRRAVGTLHARRGRLSLPILGSSDDAWWSTFDPTRRARCSVCSFLPVCWGGCPKKHLEEDAHALREQGAYWRTNLARLVATGSGRTPASDFTYSEDDQFRVGMPTS